MVTESSRTIRASADDLAYQRGILPGVSRTFALTIPVLPDTLAVVMTNAYLLCRLADTIEDDPELTHEQKSRFHARFVAVVKGEEDAASFALDLAPLLSERVLPAEHDLVRNTAVVLRVTHGFSAQERAVLTRCVTIMCRGMPEFQRNKSLRGLADPTELAEYCYYVAGTVGCMLTELWHEHARAVGKREFERLWAKCQSFGEALQTVNILKDIAWDAQHENAIYIPALDLKAQGSGHETLLSPEHLEHNHKAVVHFIELARTDLDDALEYTLMIPRRAFRIRAFCVLPLLFAYATLRDLSGSRAMLTVGGQVKISRREVKALMIVGLLSLVSNSALRRLVRRVKVRPFTLVPAVG